MVSNETFYNSPEYSQSREIMAQEVGYGGSYTQRVEHNLLLAEGPRLLAPPLDTTAPPTGAFPYNP